MTEGGTDRQTDRPPLCSCPSGLSDFCGGRRHVYPLAMKSYQHVFVNSPQQADTS